MTRTKQKDTFDILKDLDAAISYIREKIKSKTAKAADTEAFRKLLLAKAEALVQREAESKTKRREPYTANLRIAVDNS